MKAVLGVLVLCACGGAPPDLPTAEVVRGDFAVTHFEGGEVRAASGEVVASPRIGGRLKIVHLWPEGEQVDVGDLILQFDPAEFEREMLDREGQLEQAHSDFVKAKAEREQRLADIKRKIQQRQAELKLAVLNQERQQFASTIDQEQGRINLAKARRATAQARQESTAQEVVNRVDFRKHELNIARRQERYERAKRDSRAHQHLCDQTGDRGLSQNLETRHRRGEQSRNRGPGMGRPRPARNTRFAQDASALSDWRNGHRARARRPAGLHPARSLPRPGLQRRWCPN